MSRNFHRFVRYLESKDIPYYGVEISLDDLYESVGMPTFIKIKASISNVLFQKECAINLAEKQIPEKYTKIAWIDHDVFFHNDNWYDEASEMLNRYKIVQLFSRCIDTDEYGRNETINVSFMKNAVNSSFRFDKSNYNFGLFGMAWAAQRDLWSYGGLYPYCFLGGGDGLFDMAIFDLDGEERLQFIHYSRLHKNRNEYISWKNNIAKFASKNDAYYLDNRIYHEWHGDRDNRKYRTRYDLAKNFTLDNVLINKDGILETNNIDEFQKEKFFKYFLERTK